MKWVGCELLTNVEVSKDRLNNPVFEEQKATNFLGRLSNWTVDEITALGRDYTAVHRKLIARLPISIIKSDMLISVNGIKYQIDSISDLGRFLSIHISAYKV